MGTTFSHDAKRTVNSRTKDWLVSTHKIMSRGISAPAPGSHSFTAAIIPLEIPTAGEKAAKHSALLREFSTPATSPAYLGPQYISNPPTTPTPAPIPAQSPMTASPTTPLSPPTRSLDVIKKRAGHGRIIFCKARSNHKSQTLDYFAGRRLKSRTISEMKMKLWWHLKPDHYTTADYLATAAVPTPSVEAIDPY